MTLNQAMRHAMTGETAEALRIVKAIRRDPETPVEDVWALGEMEKLLEKVAPRPTMGQAFAAWMDRRKAKETV